MNFVFLLDDDNSCAAMWNVRSATKQKKSDQEQKSTVYHDTPQCPLRVPHSTLTRNTHDHIQDASCLLNALAPVHKNVNTFYILTLRICQRLQDWPTCLRAAQNLSAATTVYFKQPTGKNQGEYAKTVQPLILLFVQHNIKTVFH